MENNTRVNRNDEEILNNVDVPKKNASNKEENDINREDNGPSNYNAQITRRSKKRKHHYNVIKNKKWNKPYKRQKLSNTSKPDVDNPSQNNRNKKLPKIIFNNKQAMHRGGGLSKFFLPDKRPRKDIIVPPTKFLLGGNISDPLNLNSLQDEALVSMSAITPKSSPITTPPKVEVIIPPNIYDPLHLLDPVDTIEYEKQLVSPIKNRRLNKQRTKRKKTKTKNNTSVNQTHASEAIELKETPKVDASHIILSPKNNISNDILDNIAPESCEAASNSVNPEQSNQCLHLDLNDIRKRKNSENCDSNCFSIGNANKKMRRFDSKDKIVSPVIPQPGAWKRPPKVLLGAPRNRNRTTSASDTDNTEEPNTRKTSCEEDKVAHQQITKSNVDCEPRFDSKPVCALHESSFAPCDNEMFFKYEPNKHQYGSYPGQYCGLRTLLNFSDVRLTVFLRHAYLFKDKDILDIGCNVGHMTIAVARKLHPKSVLGIDIDKDLIARARRNLSIFHCVPDNDLRNVKTRGKGKLVDKCQTDYNAENEKRSKKAKIGLRVKDRTRNDSQHSEYFPMTFPICFGTLPNIRCSTESPSASPAVDGSQNMKILEQTSGQNNPVQGTQPSPLMMKLEADSSTQSDGINTFPNNVFFRTLNYAVTEESQMMADKQQYDLILCLSLTKWIHLNFGDAGLKMTFRRMFNQLRPGGKLILEAQNWASYKKRKKLTPTIYENYKNIEFFPNNFHEYLLSPEVGFSHSYTLGVPRHASKGFLRPIQLYIKGDFTPSQVRWSDTYHPQTPYEPRVRYTHYVDSIRNSLNYGSNSSHWNHKNITNLYKSRHYTNRYNTPSHGFSASTSRYYNPLETDSYLPSYDNVVQTRHYCFASPLYATVWSPPTSGRRSGSQTPLFGSIRRVDSDEQDTKHVYLTYTNKDSGGSSRSIDENNSASPQTHVYATDSSRSVRESDTDANTNSPKEHVYAFQE